MKKWLLFPAVYRAISLLGITLLLSNTFLPNATAQCGTYGALTPTTPDVCTSAYNLSPAINQCQKVCIDMTTATGGTPLPPCGSGVLTNDIWLTFANPYTNIPNYDGSLVIAWKGYPGNYPNNNPTLALHLEVQGSVSLGIFPVPLSINCTQAALGFTDPFFVQNVVCTDSGDTNYDAQVVLPAGSVPTNAQIRDLIIAQGASSGVTNATVNGTQFWMQIETFNNVPGTVCFEVSTYRSGFSCGDPTVVTFPNSGLSQTQSVSNCLCNSAQNSGYYTPATTPCSITPAQYTGTAAFYRLELPYTCNQIEARLLSWGGTGNVNVTLLSDVACPDILFNDLDGNPSSAPGLVIESSTTLASECLNLSNNSIATPFTSCLPAGSYYMLVSGATAKSNFTVSVTVNDNTPAIVQATALLEGAISPTAPGTMTTNLSTNSQLPPTQPFNTAPWNYFSANDNTPANIPANAVDWVLLELRDAANKSLILERKPGILLSNGNIVDAYNNFAGVGFNNVIPGSSYHLSIKHRNHLGAITATAVQLPNANPINFTASATAQGATTGQLALVSGGLYALKAGDCNADGVITYADLNSYVSQLLGANPYRSSDCNLSGTITLADFTLIRQNIGTIGLNFIRP